MSRKLKRYEKVAFLGEGQFATVYKAKDRLSDNRIVAVKKIKVGQRNELDDGVNRTALREIKLLQEIHHPNIIGLLDVFGKKSNISLVFDYMETDLEMIIKDSRLVLTMGHIKSYILQTFEGLEYLHANWVLHRDLKPNNLLIDDKGVVKIGDFGLAKFFGSPTRNYTNQVVTRWYRCPELLFGCRNYGTGVDVWSVGCILAELLLRKPFLPGDSDLGQLDQIFNILGTPVLETWPDVTELPEYVNFKYTPATPFSEIFSAAPDDLLQLMSRLLSLNPCLRCTCSQALQMPYFTNKPLPTAPIMLPRPSLTSQGVTNDHESNDDGYSNKSRRRVVSKRKSDMPPESGLAKKLMF